MKQIRRVKITTIRRQTVQLQPLRAYCHGCACEVEILTPSQASQVLDVDACLLDGLIAAGCIHAMQTVSGSLWVCKDSLFTK